MMDSADHGESGMVKMPGQDDRNSADRQPTKIVRVLTVIAYICSVSMAAVMLSLYYVFLWNPEPHGSPQPSRSTQPMAFTSDNISDLSPAASGFSPAAIPPTISSRLLQTVTQLVTQSASTTPTSVDSATSSPMR